MELENSQNNALAKLPMLKLGEYEMWEIRIKQYFQIQDYALWEVIENGNSWVPIPVTTPESGPSTALKMTVPSTTEEKICKKNDVKARSLLLMALPNEHQLTFNQYVDAQSMFVAIKARFGGNDATKKTQKALLKQQYENFNATSSESLDSIFNRLQKLVSRLAILGVDTPPEDLNVKFLRSLPSEWDTHVVVWMNKPDFETMGLDDLYNNFKIVEQKVKRTVAANNDDKNLAFLTTSSPSSTNTINTVNTGVSTGNTKVNTASTETSTASFSDATVYAFLSTQPQGSQLVHEDLEQLHDDDLEEMDLKWNMALLSMRARKFYQRTGRKIIIDGSSTAGYDKSKVAHQKASKGLKILLKGMCAIDGVGFDWSDMGDEKKFKLNHGYSWILRFEEPEVNEYGPRDSSVKPTTGCDKESDNSKENSDDSLEKQQVSDNESSSIKSPLKVAKATSEESMLWHRRLGHINFKNINKLVKENLVRDLPLKRFENDQTCVACLKGKQHRASCEMVLREYSRKLGLLSKNEFDEKSDEGFFVGYSLSSKAFRVYNIRTRKVQENLHIGFLENKPMIEGNGPKWLFDLDSLTQSMNYVPVVAGKSSNDFAGIQGVSESSTSSQQDQDWIVMPIWKDASYFGDASPKIVDDAQIEDKDELHDEDDATEESHDDINTGSREVSTALPEVNTATPEELVGPSPASEDSYVEEPKRVSQALRDPAWVEAMQEEHSSVQLQQELRLYEYFWLMLHNIRSSWSYQMECQMCFTWSWVILMRRYMYLNLQGLKILDHPDKDDIIFGSTKKELCDEFEKLMKDKFQMSSIGELTFFLGLQVQQNKKGIFISQDKYVHEILRKFNYSDVKSASTPTDLEKPLVQDGDAADVDEHLYRSMIGSLMYLTASRPDIMFAVCACARFQVSPKSSHLLAVKRIFRYLKGKPSLGLWYSKDSPLELVAYFC
ncbi:ribonuclease H-like domain-containing protein [Tanacetum coccineum]